ncbi:MAG: hypothetical protein ACJAVM_000777 [Sulfitobacter sp.]|jgi:hypothetical protein
MSDACDPIVPLAPLVKRDTLRISCPDPTAEDALRDMHIRQGQALVRQERWELLSQTIRDADMRREMTPGAMPVADLMAYGARADVVSAAEHVLMDGRPAKGAPLLAGIEALEHVLADHKGDHIIACIVAQAHMDIGWAWRGAGWECEAPALNSDAFTAHFDRARDIISEFNVPPHQSALLAGTACALLGGTPPGKQPVADRYEKLIDLNPANSRVMRAMGNHLLPRWYGSYDALELEARRTASRTQDTWGAGGYTWVYFDAIFNDDGACANLDLSFFIEGLHDILERRPDPYTANLLAAYCANAMGQTMSGDHEVDHIRTQIADCAHWIVRRHLTELHPMIWAHAARGFDNNLRIRSASRFAAAGREDATRIITRLFDREIAAGKRIVFTDTGPIARAG